MAIDLEVASPEETQMADNLDNQNVGDRRLWTEFRMELVQDPAKTEKAGRPIFDEVEYIKIVSPGDRNNIIDCPVNEFHRARFSTRYRAWKEGKAKGEAITGTPIEKWPEITRGDAESLRYLHIYTVEGLVGVDDVVLGKWPGLRTLRDRAKQWLEVSLKTAAASQLRADKEKSEAKVANLERQLEEMRKALARVEDSRSKEK